MTHDSDNPPKAPRAARLLAVLAAVTLAGCAGQQAKDAEEAAKNTYACQLDGERMVIRLETGEARILMPGGDRVTLYQIPAASGVRFTNGMLELRGKGMEMQLVRDGTATTLVGCAPYVPPR